MGISTVGGANDQSTYPGWCRPATNKGQREPNGCTNEWTAELAAKKRARPRGKGKKRNDDHKAEDETKVTRHKKARSGYNIDALS